MKSVEKSTFAVHWTRAQSFINTMKFFSGDRSPTYAGALALLAVHGAISLNDAVLIRFTGKRNVGKDHSTASGPLTDLCNRRKADTGGIKHLAWLLSRKSDFAYGDRPLTLAETLFAVTTAERFIAWVYRTFPEVANEDQSGT